MSTYAIQRLDRARQEFDAMRSAPNGDVFKRSMEACLVDLRSTFEFAQRDSISRQKRIGGKRARSACKEWFAAEHAAADSDELISWAWSTRIAALHEGHTGLAESFHNAHLDTDDVIRPEGFEHADLLIDADGVWLVMNEGSARERRIRPVLRGRSASAPDVHLIHLKDAPRNHQGVSIDAASPVELVEAALRWTEEFLDTVLARWWT